MAVDGPGEGEDLWVRQLVRRIRFANRSEVVSARPDAQGAREVRELAESGRPLLKGLRSAIQVGDDESQLLFAAAGASERSEGFLLIALRTRSVLSARQQDTPGTQMPGWER